MSSRNEGPPRSKKFHQHINFKLAQKHFESRNVLVIAGPSGSGKTELARQLVKEFRESRRSKVINGEFRCDSLVDCAIPEIEKFARRKELQWESFQHEDPDDVFARLYKSVNEMYADRYKVFLFDDADVPTDILCYIDQNILVPLYNLPEDNALRKTWKIIITTQASSDSWEKKCDQLADGDFLKVTGFSKEEMEQFINESRKAQSLNEEELETIRKELGTRPLMLQVLRKDLDAGESASSALRTFISGIDKHGMESRDVTALCNSLVRLVKQSEHVDEYKELIMLLSMFNPTDFTSEFLTSCAEVTLDGKIPAQENFCRRAYLLGVDLINDMMNRFLCESPEPFDKTSIVSFHKLIMRSMELLRGKDLPPPVDKRDINLARKALIALTRVMPRDGRGHQSQVIYYFMYNHACSLAREVDNLLHKELINRKDTPCIMLWMSKLHMTMAFCQQSMRLLPDRIEYHINEALDWFSLLAADRKYDHLRAEHPNLSLHVQKARTLFDEITGPQSMLKGNQEYEGLVGQVQLFLRLTPRDVQILFENEIKEPPGELPNGHIVDSQLAEFRHKNQALKEEKLREVYPVELLAEIYSTAAKALGSVGDGFKTPLCTGYAEAAAYLHTRIRTELEVPLLAEVTTARDRLNAQLKDDNLTAEQLDLIIAEWRGLSETDFKAFEYGLMRANFSNDPYNKFLCMEGRAVSEGRKCTLSRNPDEIARICLLFEELVSITKIKEVIPRLHMNYQTISKVYRNYGEFLWRCGELRNAVRALIDAFIYLNYFLRRNTEMTAFPELGGDCGKGKSVLKLLRKYFESYEQNHSADGLLQRDDTDQLRLIYVSRIVRAWRKMDPIPERFDVMERILQASGVGPDGIDEDLASTDSAMPMEIDENFT